MSRPRKIQTVETWEEFRENCIYCVRITTDCKCAFDNGMKDCTCPELCNRVKQPPKRQPKPLPTWKYQNSNGYSAYTIDHDSAFSLLVEDGQWHADINKSIPALDVVATIQKASLYWRSPKGWEKKIKCNDNEINWRQTYRNACAQEWNQVWSSAPIESYEKREREQLIADIKTQGAELARVGIVKPSDALDSLSEAKRTHYGNMQVLYATGTIDHLKYIKQYLTDMSCAMSLV